MDKNLTIMEKRYLLAETKVFTDYRRSVFENTKTESVFCEKPKKRQLYRGLSGKVYWF